MRNLLTLAFSFLLLACSIGTVWVLLTLSGNLVVERTDPGNSAEVVVP